MYHLIQIHSPSVFFRTYTVLHYMSCTWPLPVKRLSDSCALGTRNYLCVQCSADTVLSTVLALIVLKSAT